MTCELTWGDLVLHTDAPGGGLFWFETLGSSFDLGRPEPVTQTIESFLADGSLVATQRHENRSVSFFIWVCADDGEGLAQGEAALFAQAQLPLSEAHWTPVSDFSATCCFQVTAAAISTADAPGSQVDADLEEMARVRRCYQVTWTCLPFVLSLDTVVDVGAPAQQAPTTVTIADGTSGAGWSDTPSVSGGKLTWSRAYSFTNTSSTTTTYPVEEVATYTLGGVNFATTPYLILDLSVAMTIGEVLVDGVQASLVSIIQMPNSVIRSVYRVTATAAQKLTLHFETQVTVAPGQSASGTASWWLDNVARSSAPPVTNGSGQVLAVNVQGSARTTGSVQLSHPTVGLGKAIVYTCPQLSTGYTPPLRQWVTGTPSTSTLPIAEKAFNAGSSTAWLGSDAVYAVPAAMLPPGPYVLFAHVYSGSAKTWQPSWTAQLSVGGNMLPLVAQAQSDAVTWSAAGAKLVPCGGMVLPPYQVAANSNAVVSIKLGSGVIIDELFLLYMGDDASLTIVDCGTGTPAIGTSFSSLWLDAPSVDNGGLKKILMGVGGDRSTAIDGNLWATDWDAPALTPGPMDFYVASTGAQGQVAPTLTASHRRAFHTHVTQAA